MNSGPKQSEKKSKLRLLHQYYSYTGFYSFVKSSLGKSLLPIFIFILSLWLINEFFIDFNDLFTFITTTFNLLIVLGVFFASESLLGLIPPEIFIAWAGKTEMPVFFLTMLAVLSYVGGISSFFIGKAISNMPSVYNYL